ncbi:MAG: gamma-glutamyltransferase [Myxococcales bacterium]|nr:gamma-glutamyltransferase [Myxococcales bacterium]
MKGACAGGAEKTVEAAREILDLGGNAVDALVAACFATPVSEPVLTSLLGGGALIVRSAESGEVRVLDFFTNAPGIGGPPPDASLDFHTTAIDFGPARQSFQVGRGAAAVPGALPGLCSALERWGSLSLAEVIKPACRMLREGVAMAPLQAFAARVLAPIVMTSESSRRIYAPSGEILAEGETLAIPEVADALEDLSERGYARYHDEVLAPLLLAEFGVERGGRLTRADLDSYRVEVREPLVARYRDRTVYTNPPPALGGKMLTTMLRLLEGLDVDALGEHSTVEHTRVLAQAMRVADAARAAGALDGLQGEAGSLGKDAPLRQAGPWIEHFRALVNGNTRLDAAPDAPGGPGATTHISVVDSKGNAAGLTFSHGEGCGHVVPELGITMNNMMGEADLHPEGFHRVAPGTRLRTMMSPTLMIADDGTLTVLGSGGANRIRTALLQVISNLVDHRMDPDEAVQSPRVHFESGVLAVELDGRPFGDGGLTALGAPELTTFAEHNLFFGGVHMCRRRADGRLDGAGDRRRGGCFTITGGPVIHAVPSSPEALHLPGETVGVDNGSEP